MDSAEAAEAGICSQAAESLLTNDASTAAPADVEADPFGLDAFLCVEAAQCVSLSNALPTLCADDKRVCRCLV